MGKTEVMTNRDLAQLERGRLCDLLLVVGPDHPTLCEGWTTADLAAHLVIRERKPLAGPGIVAGGRRCAEPSRRCLLWRTAIHRQRRPNS